MKKKFLALVLTLSMVLSLVPMTALAAGGNTASAIQEGQSVAADATGNSTESDAATSGSPGEDQNPGGNDTGDSGNSDGDTGNKNPGGTEPAGPATPDTGSGAEGGNTGTGGTTEGGGTEGGGEIPSTPEASTDAAKIGATKYETIAKAIEAAESSNNTITLLRDVKENITINKPLTLDLAGFTLTGDGTDSVVTITGEDTIVTITSSALNKDETVKNGTITGGVGSKDHKFCFGGGVFIIEATVILKNLTVSENCADKVYDNTANYDRSGGGGIASVKANLTLDNVTVADNYTKNHSDGGGVCALGGQLTINNSKIENNASDDNGGGIYTENTVLKIDKAVIKNNRAPIAGGIYTANDKDIINKGQNYQLGTKVVSIPNEGSTISDTTIESNIASNIGGGLYIGGQNELKISNSTIRGNNGASQGGAIVAYSARAIELDGVSISDNTAQSGAGIYALCTVCNTDIHLLNGTAIDANTATGYGGGIYAYAYAQANTLSVTAENSSISGNTAAGGAGIFTYKADPAIINVNLNSGAVMHDNNAVTDMGGAIYAYNAANINIAANSAVYNNTAAGYGGGIYASESNINIAANSAVYNNTAATAGDDLFFYSGTSGTIFMLPNAKDMSGDRILSSDNMEITGWYHDGWNKWNAAQGSYEQIGRWTAETADEYIPVEKDSHAISLKAAHPLMYTLTYDVTGDLPEGYTAPAKQTLVKGSSYTVADVPTSVSGSKDGVNGTFSFNGWKKDDGTILTGEQQLTADLTLHGVWTFTKKSSSGGHRPSNPPVTIPDDVPTGLNGKDHYAYVVGYPDGMVYPQKNITRAEVATIFFRLLKDETREANMTKSNGYNDMKDGAWYTCAVSTLSKMGIIKGYEDGSFKPDASISRAEFAAIAARFDPDGDKTPATFSDVSSHWAKDEISIAANHGWIKGYEDGSFKPDQKITRAETMTLVNRVLKRLPETKDDLHKDMKTWPDNQNESAWFYLAVQEATNSHYQNLKKDGTHEKWESMRETRDWAALEK